ncbi:MAG: tetratricopeptide repeat protein [Oscillospiraceae bacterium]|jgi:tetratricopeptide (TPR) repeat protein|nr:tetratricopeptide repeat protein [Oscillospiraceae bacterium]
MPFGLAVAMIFAAAVILVMFAFVCSRAAEEIRLRRDAKLNIGDRVSLNRDMGAKLAYKGICAFFKKEYGKAAKHLEKAVKYSANPQNSAFCLDWMAKCYDAQEKYGDSLNCGIRAVEIAPTNVKVLFNLADRYSRSGRFEKAEYYYKSVLKYEKDNPAALFMLGEIDMGRGFYDEAEEQLKRVLEQDADFAPAAAELSVLMAIKGNYRQMGVYRDRAEAGEFKDMKRLEKRLCSIREMNALFSGAENDF